MSTTTESGGAAGDDGGIDVDALLAPLPGANPAGEDLLYAGVYDEIREARRADEQLAQGEWRREHKLADWPRVVALSAEALATRTKDLQIGAWLAEALVQLHGFTGLRDGLRLIRGLELNFWPDLYPQIEADDMDDRAKLLAWLDGQLALALKHIAITDGAGGLRYAYRHWQEAQAFDIPTNLNELDSTEQEQFAALRAQAATEGKITSEQWRTAKNTTGRSFYEATVAVLVDCWTEFNALDAATDQMFGSQTPGFNALKGTLEDVRALIERIVAEKRVLEPDTGAASAGSASDRRRIRPRRVRLAATLRRRVSSPRATRRIRSWPKRPHIFVRPSRIALCHI